MLRATVVFTLFQHYNLIILNCFCNKANCHLNQLIIKSVCLKNMKSKIAECSSLKVEKSKVSRQ